MDSCRYLARRDRTPLSFCDNDAHLDLFLSLIISAGESFAFDLQSLHSSPLAIQRPLRDMPRVEIRIRFGLICLDSSLQRLKNYTSRASSSAIVPSTRHSCYLDKRMITITRGTWQSWVILGLQDDGGALWRANLPEFQLEKVLEFHSGPIRCVASSPISYDLVSGGSDGTVRSWNCALPFCSKAPCSENSEWLCLN